MFFTFQLDFVFLYSWPMVEGSCELGVVLLSVLLSFWQFSLNCLISFVRLYVFLGDHMGCMWQWDYLKKISCPKKGEDESTMGQRKDFQIYWNIWSMIFPELSRSWKVMLFATFLYKFHIWEKFGLWDMGQIALGQSDYRVSKSNTSLEQKDEIAWFFFW